MTSKIDFENTILALRASGSSTNVHTGIGDASRIVWFDNFQPWFANRIYASDVRNKFLSIHYIEEKVLLAFLKCWNFENLF